MNFQTQFRQFHEKIHLSYKDNAELRTKRDRILKDLRDRLERPFEWFNQGSYQMGTGVKPLDGDYDLDAGVVFAVAPGDFAPNTVKEWVFKAAEGITQNVLWRNPCVTVQYVQGGKPLYHVDLAVFALDRHGRRYLSRGKQHASRDVQEWQLDDREGFQQKFAAKYSSSEDGFQLRRVVSYLKRWRQVNVPKEHWGALTGHVLTVAAYHWFDVRKNGAGEYNDLGALLELVNRMIQNFKMVGGVERLVVRFPCDPMDDVAVRMSADQMKQFKLRLEKLRDQLIGGAEGNWKLLSTAFGSDFPGV